MMPLLLSIQVGLPRSLGIEGSPDPADKPWTSAFHKSAAAGSIRLDTAGLDGDGHADMVHHGGADKAVLAYSADHYAVWRDELGGDGWLPGAFGENLTVAGGDETTVCIGDVWTLGPARLEVTQPRVPCWKLCRARRAADLAARVLQNGRSGWYLRVLTPGEIQGGMTWERLSRPHPKWTVARASQVMHHERDDLAAAAELAALPALSAAWRQTLLERLAKGTAQA